MKADAKVIEFGEKHVDTAIILDTIGGGSGFYSDPITREMTDCFALGEEWLLSNSRMYADPKVKEMQDKVVAKKDTLDLRKVFAKKTDPIGKTEELISIANEIANPHQRQVRLDQANSLKAVAKVLLADMGLEQFDLDYVDTLVNITGVSPPLIPNAGFMQEQKETTLKLMGCTKDASLGEAAAKWRNRNGLLDKETMGAAYKRSAMLMLDILKSNGLHPDANLKVKTLKEAPWLGFFDYGNKNGDIYGETCMVESDTKCIFDVIRTATHEIGGHYFVHFKWHKYAMNTGDPYAATGVMATNQAVLNEGYANCAADIFGKDLVYLFKNVGFGVEKMGDSDLQKNLAISGNLETLAMMALGYETARLFHFKDIDSEGMENEFIAFGVDPDRARIRVKYICEEKKMLRPFCYFGPGYYPGMVVIGEVLKTYGKEGTINNLCGGYGPSSLYTSNELAKSFRKI